MNEFRSNELVWAKWLNSYWPAVALDPSEWENLRVSGLEPKSDSQVLVYWIQYPPKTAMQIVPITHVQHFITGFNEKFISTTKARYKTAVKNALQIAGQPEAAKIVNQFKKLSKFDFSLISGPVHVLYLEQWKLVFPKAHHAQMVDKFFIEDDTVDVEDDVVDDDDDNSVEMDSTSSALDQKRISVSASGDNCEPSNKKKNLWQTVDEMSCSQGSLSSVPMCAMVELSRSRSDSLSESSVDGTEKQAVTENQAKSSVEIVREENNVNKNLPKSVNVGNKMETVEVHPGDRYSLKVYN